MAKSKKVASPKEAKGEYNVVLKFNDLVVDVFTDDVKGAILDAKPERLIGGLKVLVTKDGKTRDWVFSQPNGQRLFTNEYAMQSFINNLLF